MSIQTELTSIKAAIEKLAEQQESLFRLIGGRLKNHEEEADARFRLYQHEPKRPNRAIRGIEG